MSAALFFLAQLAIGSLSTGRPAECREAGAQGTNVWERAKSPELRRYCDLLASASSKLAGTAGMAEEALEAAREAERILPRRAAPLALQGRALALLGQWDRAVSVLRAAAAREPNALDDPPTLLAWARALARTGQGDDARRAYRALLPRAAALASVERVAAATEAGLLAMAAGPVALDEAAASLRDAMQGAQDDAATVAAMGLALALDRRGDLQEARALLVERVQTDPRLAMATSRAREVLAVAPGEGPALVALALERVDPAGAREAWRAYVTAGPDGPWAAHARAHWAALGEHPARSAP